MTQYFAAVEFVHVPQGAESPGSAPLGAEASYSFSGVGLAFEADPTGGAGVVLRLPLWGVELTSADLNFLAATGMVAARTQENSQLWVNEKAAAQARLGNTPPELTLLSRMNLAASGTVSPQPAIRISGPALADYAALAAGDFANGRVTYRRAYGLKTTSPVLGGLFLDTAEGHLPTNPTSFLRSVEAKLAAGGAEVPGAVPGTYVLRGGATFVAGDPLGVVWVAPGDIGPGPAQLPTSRANNQAVLYSQYPSVWLQQSNRVNAVRLLELRSIAVTAAFGALQIMQVNRPPTHSKWLLDFNGAQLEVIVAHPAGSDLRTAKAAFDAVWRGLTAGGALTQGPVIYERSSGTGFSPIGVLNNTDLIRAFRYIEPMDAVDPNIATIYNQT